MNKEKDEFKRFDMLHDMVVKYIENDDYEGLLKMLNEDNLIANRGDLRTILMALKPTKNNKIISIKYRELMDILRKGSLTGVI